MPIIESLPFQTPWYQPTAHAQTIFPSMFRSVGGVEYKRERITTPDKDFLDIDWLKSGADKLVVMLHGLEGNATRPYMKGMANIFHEDKWDVVAVNCRSCSGEMNKKARFYHHGDIEDLACVIDHICVKYAYKHIFLVGFSMGGNIILKYLAAKSGRVNYRILGASVFSVPVEMKGCSDALELKSNAFYNKRFVKKLLKKIKIKAPNFSEISIQPIVSGKIKTLRDFDQYYSAPLHGFKDAFDFYAKSSSLPDLPEVKVPVLLVNAKNDPFLSRSCFPTTFCKSNEYISGEFPEYGGHVGFYMSGENNTYAERRALAYANRLLGKRDGYWDKGLSAAF